MKHFNFSLLMDRTLQNFIQEKMCPDGIWRLTNVMKSVLRRQISQLPRRKVSENDIRYPTTPSSMRAFLETFFTRHFFQLQNSLFNFMSSQVFLDIALSGQLRILDIGSGPAVASLAITDLVACILEYLVYIGRYPKHGIFNVRYVLNDTMPICLGTGKHMLSNYLKIQKPYYDVIINSQTIGIHKAFPDNLHQLKRIKRNIGTFDIITFSYVLIPLSEDNRFNNLIDGLLNVEEFCNRNGVILILQDRFRESLIRQISKAVGVSAHKGALVQQVYPERNTSETHTYTYYCCLYNPDKKRVIKQSYVA